MKSDQAFFDCGTQYYVAGRYAVFAHLTPVAANLLHHAIEMYLKGCLCTKFTKEQLKNDFGHNLKKLWKEFKKEVSDTALSEFDRAISRLHKFEAIRYPDKIVGSGARMNIGYKKSTPVPSGTGRTQPQYETYVDEIDRLVKAIFQKASRNPLAFKGSIGKNELAYLTKSNAANIWQ